MEPSGLTASIAIGRFSVDGSVSVDLPAGGGSGGGNGMSGNEAWFLDRAERYTQTGVRTSFLRYVAPGMLGVFALRAFADDSALAKVVMIAFFSAQLVIIVRSGLRLSAGPRAIHFHYKAVWDGLDPSNGPARSP